MAAHVYKTAIIRLLNGDLNLVDTHAIKVSILQGYTWAATNHANHTNWDTHIKSFELPPGHVGYTSGGNELVTPRTIEDDTTAGANRIEWHGSSVQWGSPPGLGTTTNLNAFVSYISGSGPWTGVGSPNLPDSAQYVPLTYHSTTTNANGGSYTIQWDAQGIAQFAYTGGT